MTRTEASCLRRTTGRSSFTAIELVVVMGIMLLLAGMTLPAVLPSLRKGALHSAANDIESCWRQARTMAMTGLVPQATNPPFFGIVISQTNGGQGYVELIYDSVGPGQQPQPLVQGQNPLDPTTYNASATPIAKYLFNKNVLVSTNFGSSGTATTGNCLITVYAQYGTGLPVDPAAVQAGNGTVNPPTSIGVTSPTILANNSTLGTILQLQTPDFVQGTSGYAIGLQLYHAGIFTTNSIQE